MENETVSQWVDADNVRSLAEELMKPAEPPAPVTPEAIYGSGFVGFAEPEPDSDSAEKSTEQPKAPVAQTTPAESVAPKPVSEKPATPVAAPTTPPVVSSPEPRPVEKPVAPLPSTPAATSDAVAKPPVSEPAPADLAARKPDAPVKKEVVDPRPAVKAAAPLSPPAKEPSPDPPKAEPASSSPVKPAPLVPPQPPLSESPPSMSRDESKEVVSETAKSAPVPEESKAEKVKPKPAEVEEPEVITPVPLTRRPEAAKSSKPVADEAKPAKEVTVTPTKKPAPVVHKVRFKSPFKIVTNIEEAREGSEDPIAEKKEVSAKPSTGGSALLGRLASFGDWLKEKVPVESHFICDLNGQVLVDEIGSSKLIDVARSLAKTSGITMRQDPAADSESLHVRISSEKVMEVIPCKCHFGIVILGLVVPRPLSRDIAGAVSEALAKALAEG